MPTISHQFFNSVRLVASISEIIALRTRNHSTSNLHHERKPAITDQYSPEDFFSAQKLKFQEFRLPSKKPISTRPVLKTRTPRYPLSSQYIFCHNNSLLQNESKRI